MKVLRLHNARDLRLHDEQIPVAGEAESLLKVGAIGVCGSDLHWFGEGGIGSASLPRPLVLGHEFAATVEQGANAGRSVAVDPAIACGRCEFCLEGNPNLCANILFAGHTPVDGAFREFMSWPDRCLFPLPDTLDAVDGAMLEPLGVAIQTTDLGKIKPGMAVGVYGSGPVGLLVIQLARISGATQIIATDILPHRLQTARSLGATHAFLAEEGAEAAQILSLTHQRGVDVAIEVAGENSAVETAIESVKPGGCVVLCGIPSDDRISFSAGAARRKGLTIKLVRRMKHTYPRAIRLVESGLVDVRSLVSHTFALSEYEQAFAVAERREGLKVVLKP
jgi:L-iditol 2-dehydrogenase